MKTLITIAVLAFIWALVRGAYWTLKVDDCLKADRDGT